MKCLGPVQCAVHPCFGSTQNTSANTHSAVVQSIHSWKTQTKPKNTFWDAFLCLYSTSWHSSCVGSWINLNISVSVADHLQDMLISKMQLTRFWCTVDMLWELHLMFWSWKVLQILPSCYIELIYVKLTGQTTLRPPGTWVDYLHRIF